ANLGSVKNAGLEATLGGQLVDRRNLGIDFQFNTSINANKVVSLGSVPPQIGVTNWTVSGYPISGIWTRPILGWHDDNQDGILTGRTKDCYDKTNPACVGEIDIGVDTLFDDTIDPATGKAKHTVIGVGTFRGQPLPR